MPLALHALDGSLSANVIGCANGRHAVKKKLCLAQGHIMSSSIEWLARARAMLQTDAGTNEYLQVVHHMVGELVAEVGGMKKGLPDSDFAQFMKTRYAKYAQTLEDQWNRLLASIRICA
jgi:hypothetical protein